MIITLDTEVRTSEWLKRNKHYYSTYSGDSYITYKLPNYKITYHQIYAKCFKSGKTYESLGEFRKVVLGGKIKYIVGYNISVDIFWLITYHYNDNQKKHVEFIKMLLKTPLIDLQHRTKKVNFGRYMRLESYYNRLFNKNVSVSHNAKKDVCLTEKIFDMYYKRDGIKCDMFLTKPITILRE